MLALLLAALLATAVAAQEPPEQVGGGAAGQAGGRATRTPRRSREVDCPPTIGKVVTDKQREEIYEIQAKYNEQIEKLKKELEVADCQAGHGSGRSADRRAACGDRQAEGRASCATRQPFVGRRDVRRGLTACADAGGLRPPATRTRAG